MQNEPGLGSAPGRIDVATVGITTSDGVRLAADTARVEQPRGAVVLAHPHPLYGGNRFSPVIDRLFGLLPSVGLDAVRFDFRGGGESGGSHDHGRSERDDVLAAASVIAPGRPVVLVGYSFGSAVCLSIEHPSVVGWAAIAPPLSFDFAPGLRAPTDPRPKLLLAPEHDQYCTHEALLAIVARDAWTATRVDRIDSTDHFLSGRIDRVATTVVDWCLELFT